MIDKVFIMPHPPIIIPKIGGGKEIDAQKTIEGCQKAARAIAAEKPDTIIVLSPHGPSYSNVVCIAGDSILKGDFSNFGHKKLSYEFQNNMDLVKGIAEKLNAFGITPIINDHESRNNYDIDPSIDHGALVPLHFILKEYKEFELVHIATAIPDPEELYKCGVAIREASLTSDKKILLIASSDLSHRLTDDGPYEYNPEGVKYDQFVVDCIKEKAFSSFMNVNRNMRECAGECGHRAITISLGIFEGQTCKTDIFSYEGPYGVGYLVAEISGQGLGESILDEYRKIKYSKIADLRKNESEYVKLARKTIEQYIKTGEKLKTETKDSEKKATFVSIKKHGILRGCIGTIHPTKDSVEEEIISNAVEAATKDPRFPPIIEEELIELTISVDILYPPEKITSPKMLNTKEYGVIVSKGLRRGLLLPNLEGIDTVDKQIEIACDKGGIRQNEAYSLERFKVVRYK